MSLFKKVSQNGPKSSVVEGKDEKDAEKKASDKAKNKAEKRAKYKVKQRFAYASVMIPNPVGYRVKRFKVVESPETDEDVKRMVKSLEEVRVQLSRDTGNNPTRIVPMTEWELTPKEMKRFKNRGQFIPIVLSELSMAVYNRYR